MCVCVCVCRDLCGRVKPVLMYVFVPLWGHAVLMHVKMYS